MYTIFNKNIIIKVVLSFGICLVLLACKTKKMEADKDSSNDFLANCWKHSHEEEAGDGLKIYRPCDYKTFPPSRYRNTFTLNTDHTCNASVLAANDAHYSKEGNWTFDKETKLLQVNNGKMYNYEVIAVTEDKLIVKIK